GEAIREDSVDDDALDLDDLSDVLVPVLTRHLAPGEGFTEAGRRSRRRPAGGCSLTAGAPTGRRLLLGEAGRADVGGAIHRTDEDLVATELPQLAHLRLRGVRTRQ